MLSQNVRSGLLLELKFTYGAQTGGNGMLAIEGIVTSTQGHDRLLTMLARCATLMKEIEAANPVKESDAGPKPSLVK